MDLAIHFFLQLTVILGVCRVVGLLARRVGQPQVVGEMIAGVLLGPSLLGLVLPGVQHALFPSGPAVAILFTFSQVGLVLYMFLIGLEFDTGLIRHRVRSAVSVSLAGILTPLVLGGGIALVLVGQSGVFFTPRVLPWQAMLFVGAAIAITAFPMLARIIVERGLAGTSVGTLALAAGATDDAVSWIIFAVVLAVFQHNAVIAVVAILGGALYAAGMLTVGRRLLARLGRIAERADGVRPPLLAVVLMLVMLSAWFTDVIGIYAIFGAFLLGVAMPRGVLARDLRTLLEPIVTNFLLPLFFVFSGLNTQIGLVNSWALWGLTLLVLVAAVLGKGVACTAAALLNKEPRREALAIGSLMNARGLIELILTTLMASPLIEFFYGRFRPPAVPVPVPALRPAPAS